MKLRDLSHPRALLDSWLTYPRYMGSIKPMLLDRSIAEREAWLRSMGTAWWPKNLECPLGRRILVITPHPDDETVGAGGFLLRHRKFSEIHVISVFNGEGGGRLARIPTQDDQTYRAELVQARREELLSVSARLGVVSVQYLELPDGQVSPNMVDAARLREMVATVNPDVVLLPWFLDGHIDHRVTNVLYAWSCAGFSCAVLGFEVWTMLQPNAVLNIAAHVLEKYELLRLYRSQLATVDYQSLCEGLAKVRAFYYPVEEMRGGAAEAFFALPNREYCSLVTSIYGEPNTSSAQAMALLS